MEFHWTFPARGSGSPFIFTAHTSIWHREFASGPLLPSASPLTSLLRSLVRLPVPVSVLGGLDPQIAMPLSLSWHLCRWFPIGTISMRPLTWHATALCSPWAESWDPGPRVPGQDLSSSHFSGKMTFKNFGFSPACQHALVIQLNFPVALVSMQPVGWGGDSCPLLGALLVISSDHSQLSFLPSLWRPCFLNCTRSDTFTSLTIPAACKFLITVSYQQNNFNYVSPRSKVLY